jgi:hypothetical protein
MTTNTVFSAKIETLLQASRIWETLKDWVSHQDKSKWKSHGYYITIHERSLFFFNFLIDCPDGISKEKKEEISKIFQDFGLTNFSILVKPHPA